MFIVIFNRPAQAGRLNHIISSAYTPQNSYVIYIDIVAINIDTRNDNMRL